MKKILAIFMALVVFSSFAFFAVGSGDDDSSTPTQDNSVVTDDTTTEAPVKKVSRGTVLGDVYSNDYIGIKFTKTSDWNFATDDELAAIIDAGAETVDFSDVEYALSEMATVYDMMVSDAYGNSVSVMYENTMLSALKKMNEEEYLEIFKENTKSVTGMTYTHIRDEDVTLGNTTFKRASYYLTSNGISINQYVYVKSFDKYMAVVVVTATNKSVDTIEAMFS